MIDKEFAIEILEQYHEKPTLINEIELVEEAVWLDDALEMGIKALRQEPILDKIRAEIERYKSIIDDPIYEGELKVEGMKKAYANCIEIIDKYK